MRQKTKILKQRLLTEIKNYKQRYTIYMLVCNITGDTYYGSTCQPLKERLYGHISSHSCSSKIIIDRNDYLPLIPLETDLSYCKKMKREHYYITNNACVNKYGAKFTVEKRKQLRTKYYQKNKEYEKQKNAIWYKNNKEKQAEYYQKNKEKKAEYCQKNKEFKQQYDYWKRTYHLGILARVYFD